MKINRKNLKILRDYVKKNVTQEMFSMANFRNRADSAELLGKENYFTDCGTTGCLLGWLPHLGGSEKN